MQANSPGSIKNRYAASGLAWWPVYNTITDILCLLALVWLTRREGLNLIDLFTGFLVGILPWISQ